MLIKSDFLLKVRLISIVLSFIIISVGVGYAFGQRQISVDLSKTFPRIRVVNSDKPSDKRSVDFSLFWHVWNELEGSYLDQSAIDHEKMVFGAISGMVASLDDPYTVFLEPTENRKSKEDLSGSFYGVGIQLGYKKRRLAVIAPLEGMPAERAGIQAGDLILKVRDEGKGVDRDMQDVTLPEAVTIIRGEKGTEVFLTLFREESEEPFEIGVIRDEIVVPSVELEFIEGPLLGGNEGLVAHLKITQFGERTMQEWKTAVDEILAKRKVLSGIVLDMRNNPGGYLTSSVDIASEFLSEGTVVVQQGRRETETFSVKRAGRLVGIPVVVLVNNGSASASEIVAGALRDRIGAVLVGETTFGKGTVQEARDLPGGAGLHVTTANWVLPSGQKINDKGLTPAVEVTLEEDEEGEEGVDEQLEKAVEVLLE